jgi:hypothetical protein
MNLARVQELLAHSGPYTTVHADVSRNSEDARQALDARWTTIRHDLEHHGFEEKRLGEVEERLRRPSEYDGEVRRTLVLSEDDVLLDEDQPGHHHWPETVDHGALPDLSAWLSQADREIPFVLVVADRVGGDISAHSAASRPATSEASVSGYDHWIRKIPGGGWAHRRIQETAEDRWQKNAREVADAVESMVRSHRPEVVMLAGEERARSEVSAALEEASTPMTVWQLTSGGRAAGSDEDAMWEEIAGGLGQIEGRRDAELSARLDEVRGRGEGGAFGMEEVLQMLTQARVERLVLDLEVMHERTVRVGDHPGLPLPASAAQASELPADRVFVAAAAATGAELSNLPAELSHGGGVAALLRWET